MIRDRATGGSTPPSPAPESAPTPAQEKRWIGTNIGLFLALVLVSLIGSRINDWQTTPHQGQDPAEVGTADDLEQLVGLHLAQAPRKN
jgi:hypothetical protein